MTPCIDISDLRRNVAPEIVHIHTAMYHCLHACSKYSSAMYVAIVESAILLRGACPDNSNSEIVSLSGEAGEITGGERSNNIHQVLLAAPYETSTARVGIDGDSVCISRCECDVWMYAVLRYPSLALMTAVEYPAWMARALPRYMAMTTNESTSSFLDTHFEWSAQPNSRAIPTDMVLGKKWIDNTGKVEKNEARVMVSSPSSFPTCA